MLVELVTQEQSWVGPWLPNISDLHIWSLNNQGFRLEKQSFSVTLAIIKWFADCRNNLTRTIGPLFWDLFLVVTMPLKLCFICLRLLVEYYLHSFCPSPISYYAIVFYRLSKFANLFFILRLPIHSLFKFSLEHVYLILVFCSNVGWKRARNGLLICYTIEGCWVTIIQRWN
jgi:hypothetical protein